MCLLKGDQRLGLWASTAEGLDLILVKELSSCGCVVQNHPYPTTKYVVLNVENLVVPKWTSPG